MAEQRTRWSVLREFYWAIKRRIYVSKISEADVVARFHNLFYDSAHFGSGWSKSHWLGTPLWKSPLDLWIYQEILHETQPDVVVETGTYCGGSARYFASMFDLLGRGRIITIDIEQRPDLPQHPRITYLHGSSVAPEIVSRVHALIATGERVMVVLDSDHLCAHVLDELHAYNGLVTAGCFLIVEDSNVNGHPVWPDFGPGPFEAVEKFLSESNLFQRDLARERFLVTFNPGGYLRRIK